MPRRRSRSLLCLRGSPVRLSTPRGRRRRAFVGSCAGTLFVVGVGVEESFEQLAEEVAESHFSRVWMSYAV